MNMPELKDFIVNQSNDQKAIMQLCDKIRTICALNDIPNKDEICNRAIEISMLTYTEE